MWNQSESDKKYYERRDAYEAKRKISLSKAENRGKVAVEWFNAGNKLTQETQPEFNALMGKADKDLINKLEMKKDCTKIGSG